MSGVNLRGKLGLRVVLGPDASRSICRAGVRSFIGRRRSTRLFPTPTLRRSNRATKTYGNLGMEMMQRAYCVAPQERRADLSVRGTRAEATGMASTMFADNRRRSGGRGAGVTIRELGTVEGKGGFLGVWGTHAPDWSAPASIDGAAAAAVAACRLDRHPYNVAGHSHRFSSCVILAPVDGRSEMTEPEKITEYHAHIYYDPATTRGRAERLRERVAGRLSAGQGRPLARRDGRPAPAIDVSGRLPEPDAGAVRAVAHAQIATA